jgi:putative transposase
MTNSYTSLLVHIVFSTRNRERVFISDVRDRLWAYMGGIARENNTKAIQIGGMLDYVHMLIWMFSTIGVSKAVQLIKGGSSKWLHGNYSALRNFALQEGYGAFSIGANQVDMVSSCIAHQEEHHRMKTFQEE